MYYSTLMINCIVLIGLLKGCLQTVGIKVFANFLLQHKPLRPNLALGTVLSKEKKKVNKISPKPSLWFRHIPSACSSLKVYDREFDMKQGSVFLFLTHFLLLLDILAAVENLRRISRHVLRLIGPSVHLLETEN